MNVVTLDWRAMTGEAVASAARRGRKEMRDVNEGILLERNVVAGSERLCSDICR